MNLRALALAVVVAGVGTPRATLGAPLVPDDVLHQTQFYDQTGRRFSLAAFGGKTLLLGFFVTSGPTRYACDALSAKFAYLQAHLDPRRYHLMLVSLEPQNDSPVAIRSYARVFGADPARWTLANGNFTQVTLFDWYFELVSPMHAGPSGHAELIEVLDHSGRFTAYIDAGKLAPDEIIARV